jgi:hypothetical protein
MKYVDFGSTISFYEFCQSEFKEPHFNLNEYETEINLLSRPVTIDYLVKVLESNPKTFDIFEEILQLQCFTDAQYINFCFDVRTLNNADGNVLRNHIEKHVFKFENGTLNENFQKIYANITKTLTPEFQDVVFCAKRAIVQYVKKLSKAKLPKTRQLLYNHIVNSIATRLRIAEYLVENLNACEQLASLNLESFLRHKRQPIDSKGLHGKFGIIKISQILDADDFTDVTHLARDKDLQPEKPVNIDDIPEFSYVKEKYVAGINKRKDRKPKKFDFVLLHRGKPRILMETNFYSTSGGGTKIGINQDEYVDLNEDIKKYGLKNKCGLDFIWITDGNYWLSGDGETRFTNLKTHYFTDPIQLLNFNLFKKSLANIKKVMRRHK